MPTKTEVGRDLLGWRLRGAIPKQISFLHQRYITMGDDMSSGVWCIWPICLCLRIFLVVAKSQRIIRFVNGSNLPFPPPKYKSGVAVLRLVGPD